MRRLNKFRSRSLIESLSPSIRSTTSRLILLSRRRAHRPLGVRFPKAALYTVSTAAELVEHHPGRARVHGIVPVKPAHRIGSAIHVVDIIIHDDRVAILDPIFGHDP